MSGKILPVSDENFETAVLQSEKPVLVQFWADWCGLCSRLDPILDELALDQADALTIARLNVQENQMTAMENGIQGIPTMMLFKGGGVVAVKKGAPSRQQLDEFLSPHLQTQGAPSVPGLTAAK